MESTFPGIGSLSSQENNVMSSGANLTAPLQSEIGVLQGNEITIRPLSLTDDGPLEFPIEQRGNQFIQLWTTRLYLKCKLLHSDGSEIDDDLEMGPVNLFGSSLFHSIQASINDQSFPDLCNTDVGYKDMMQTLLTYNKTAADTHLKASMMYHELSPDSDKQWKKKIVLCKQSKSFDLCFIPPLDLLFGERFFPMDFRLSLKFLRHSDAFCLLEKKTTTAPGGGQEEKTLSGKSFKVKIERKHSARALFLLPSALSLLDGGLTYINTLFYKLHKKHL
jgi:hypothetical protein